MFRTRPLQREAGLTSSVKVDFVHTQQEGRGGDQLLLRFFVRQTPDKRASEGTPLRSDQGLSGKTLERLSYRRSRDIEEGLVKPIPWSEVKEAARKARGAS